MANTRKGVTAWQRHPGLTKKYALAVNFVSQIALTSLEWMKTTRQSVLTQKAHQKTIFKPAQLMLVRFLVFIGRTNSYKLSYCRQRKKTPERMKVEFMGHPLVALGKSVKILP